MNRQAAKEKAETARKAQTTIAAQNETDGVHIPVNKIAGRCIGFPSAKCSGKIRCIQKYTPNYISVIN